MVGISIRPYYFLRGGEYFRRRAHFIRATKYQRYFRKLSAYQPSHRMMEVVFLCSRAGAGFKDKQIYSLKLLRHCFKRCVMLWSIYGRIQLTKNLPNIF